MALCWMTQLGLGGQRHYQLSFVYGCTPKWQRRPEVQNVAFDKVGSVSSIIQRSGEVSEVGVWWERTSLRISVPVAIPEIEGAFDLGVSSVEEKDATDRHLARIRLSLSSPEKKEEKAGPSEFDAWGFWTGTLWYYIRTFAKSGHDCIVPQCWES
ncbi:hypothetical protein C8R48DRAFT_675809 [Suillus tomentosus]|nr:hypothetical protein C8R48DRAFT_675809 [Suillus tomentosus]